MPELTAPPVAAPLSAGRFPPSASRIPRVASIDVTRGAVMVLMAVDHVRVYSGVPAGGPTAGVFFTRWVTHFCAPVFVFLAGTAAFLHLRKLGDKGALAKYLVTRGLLLVVLELTVIANVLDTFGRVPLFYYLLHIRRWYMHVKATRPRAWMRYV